MSNEHSFEDGKEKIAEEREEDQERMRRDNGIHSTLQIC